MRQQTELTTQEHDAAKWCAEWMAGAFDKFKVTWTNASSYSPVFGIRKVVAFHFETKEQPIWRGGYLITVDFMMDHKYAPEVHMLGEVIERWKQDTGEQS